MWPSVETVKYASSEWCESSTMPGVRYEIAKVSLVRRTEITKRVRALLTELEYRKAGAELEDRLGASELESAIDRVYVEWGLLRVSHLEIDGEEAGVAALVQRGPERLCREIAASIRKQCSLSEDERKN